MLVTGLEVLTFAADLARNHVTPNSTAHKDMADRLAQAVRNRQGQEARVSVSDMRSLISRAGREAKLYSWEITMMLRAITTGIMPSTGFTGAQAAVMKMALDASDSTVERQSQVSMLLTVSRLVEGMSDGFSPTEDTVTQAEAEALQATALQPRAAREGREQRTPSMDVDSGGGNKKPASLTYNVDMKSNGATGAVDTNDDSNNKKENLGADQEPYTTPTTWSKKSVKYGSKCDDENEEFQQMGVEMAKAVATVNRLEKKWSRSRNPKPWFEKFDKIVYPEPKRKDVYYGRYGQICVLEAPPKEKDEEEAETEGKSKGRQGVPGEGRIPIEQVQRVLKRRAGNGGGREERGARSPEESVAARRVRRKTNSGYATQWRDGGGSLAHRAKSSAGEKRTEDEKAEAMKVDAIVIENLTRMTEEEALPAEGIAMTKEPSVGLGAGAKEELTPAVEANGGVGVAIGGGGGQIARGQVWSTSDERVLATG